jgi:hypothetical protein
MDWLFFQWVRSQPVFLSYSFILSSNKSQFYRFDTSGDLTYDLLVYATGGEQANHYTTEAVTIKWPFMCRSSSLSILYSITSLASFLMSASGLYFSLCMMLLTLDLFLWLFATYLAALLCTVRDWNLLAPDIVELDTPEAFKARIVSL